MNITNETQELLSNVILLLHQPQRSIIRKKMT